MSESLRESGAGGLSCPDTTGGGGGRHEAVTASGAAQTPKSSVVRGLLDGGIPQSLRCPGQRRPRSAFRKRDPGWRLGAGPGGKPHAHGLAGVLLRLHLWGVAGLVG